MPEFWMFLMQYKVYGYKVTVQITTVEITEQSSYRKTDVFGTLSNI